MPAATATTNRANSALPSRCRAPAAPSPVALNFGKRRDAALADRRIGRVLADVRRIIPATIASLAVGSFDANADRIGGFWLRGGRCGFEVHLRDDEERRQ